MAKSKFKLGQRVTLSERGRDQFAGPRDGTVTSIHLLAPEYVQVRRDGQKTASRWHVDFWEASGNLHTEDRNA